MNFLIIGLDFPAASNSKQPIHMVYVPSHLYHMLFELFKVRRLGDGPWWDWRRLGLRSSHSFSPLSLHRMPCEQPWKAMNPALFFLLSRSWWPWERKTCPSKYVTLDFGGKWGGTSLLPGGGLGKTLGVRKPRRRLRVSGSKTGWRVPDMSHLP